MLPDRILPPQPGGLSQRAPAARLPRHRPAHHNGPSRRNGRRPARPDGRALPEKSGGHTRHGLEAVVRSGRNAGGRAYGYRPVPGKPGQLTIDDAEAAIVRRIFREFIEGATPRAIAVGLNADRVAAPRGTRWTATTINGNLARGHGLLMNELYTGVIVWNRVRMVKDPTTGKRISRPPNKTKNEAEFSS